MSTLILLPVLVATTLIITPAKETVWWKTTGSQVLENRDKDHAECTLWLHGTDGGVFFNWMQGGTLTALVVDQAWQFADNVKLSVAIQIGDTWVSNEHGSTVMDGIGHDMSINFTLSRPIDEMLRTADHVRVLTSHGEFNIPLDHGKVDKAIEIVHKCRDTLGR